MVHGVKSQRIYCPFIEGRSLRADRRIGRLRCPLPDPMIAKRMHENRGELDPHNKAAMRRSSSLRTGITTTEILIRVHRVRNRAWHFDHQEGVFHVAMAGVAGIGQLLIRFGELP